MWISLAFPEGFHRVHVCDRIDADTGREREVRSVQVPLHFFFAIVLCMVGLKWGIHIITQRWAGSSPPWNPTEARVNYAAQGMAAVRRNLFTMPLAIYAYVWTSTYVLMYVCTCTFSVLWEIRPAAPTCQPFSCGFDVRRDRLWVKYRGKRIIGTYPTKWVERGGNQEKKKKKKKTEARVRVLRFSRRQRGCPGTR